MSSARYAWIAPSTRRGVIGHCVISTAMPRSASFTAFAMADEWEECRAAGMDAHMRKPATLDDYARMVEEAYAAGAARG